MRENFPIPTLRVLSSTLIYLLVMMVRLTSSYCGDYTIVA